MDQDEYDKAAHFDRRGATRRIEKAERGMKEFLKQVRRERNQDVAKVMQESLQGDQKDPSAVKIVSRMTGYSTEGAQAGFSRGDDAPATGREPRLWDRD